MDAIKSFFEAIPAASTNAFALVAYIVAAIAVVALRVRVARLKQIGKLAPAEQAAALQADGDYVPVPTLSANQWIRQRVHSHYFRAFLALLFVVMVISVVALVEMRRERASPNNDNAGVSRSDPPPAMAPSPAATHILHVVTKPDGVDVIVDGKWVGSSPANVKLSPGQHKITLRMTGYRPYENLVTVPDQTVVSWPMEPAQ